MKVLLFLLATSAFANVLKIQNKTSSFSVNGTTMRVRYQQRTDTPSPNRTHLAGLYDLQLRANLRYEKNKDLGIVFTPQISKSFGNGTPNNNNVNEGEAKSAQLADLGAMQAFLFYNPTKKISLKIGRQALKFGDGILINNPAFNNNARVFDAILSTFKHSMGETDLFYSKVNDGETDSGLARGRAQNDTDLLGIYQRFNFGDIDAFDLYFYYYNDKGTSTNLFGKSATDRQTTKFYGLRFREKFDKLFATTELIFQEANNIRISDAMLWRLELGYDFTNKFTFLFESMFAKKDYRAFNTARHRYLGHLDIFGIRNIWGLRGRFKYKFSKTLDGQMDLHNFRRVSNRNDVYNHIINATLGSRVGLDGEKSLGNEVDFKFNAKLDKGFKLSAGYAYFKSGDYFKRQSITSDAHYGYTELNIKF